MIIVHLADRCRYSSADKCRVFVLRSVNPFPWEPRQQSWREVMVLLSEHSCIRLTAQVMTPVRVWFNKGLSPSSFSRIFRGLLCVDHPSAVWLAEEVVGRSRGLKEKKETRGFVMYRKLMKYSSIENWPDPVIDNMNSAVIYLAMWRLMNDSSFALTLLERKRTD